MAITLHMLYTKVKRKATLRRYFGYALHNYLQLT